VSIWGVPGLEVDSFVHEVRTFDRHLPACGKVDQSEVILICTHMQAVLAYHWLMYGFPANFCVYVSHHQLHVMTWAGINGECKTIETFHDCLLLLMTQKFSILGRIYNNIRVT
jgi:hypothetical protein